MREYNDLKNIGKKEYVEKESLAKHIDNSFGEISTPFVVKEIRNFPVSDVVEVVRCKDCIFCRYVSSADIYKCDRRGFYAEEVKTTDYCSRGERSEKGEKMSTLEKAVATYGKDMQLTVACEELSELIKEICKNIRGSDNVESITEEMADCYIMMDQLAIIFGIKNCDINAFIDEKLARLEKRMAEREGAR